MHIMIKICNLDRLHNVMHEAHNNVTFIYGKSLTFYIKKCDFKVKCSSNDI